MTFPDHPTTVSMITVPGGHNSHDICPRSRHFLTHTLRTVFCVQIRRSLFLGWPTLVTNKAAAKVHGTLRHNGRRGAVRDGQVFPYH